jgi:hypothetical protein
MSESSVLCAVAICPEKAVDGSIFCTQHLREAQSGPQQKPDSSVAAVAATLGVGLAGSIIFETGKSEYRARTTSFETTAEVLCRSEGGPVVHEVSVPRDLADSDVEQVIDHMRRRLGDFDNAEVRRLLKGGIRSFRFRCSRD